jgi:hypothetical protein
MACPGTGRGWARRSVDDARHEVGEGNAARVQWGGMSRENPWCLRAPRWLALVLTAGCGGGGASYSLPVGSDDGGSGSFVGDDAGSGVFEASIQENHVTVKFITLSCARDCATVEAVASGGQPPYSFAWDDGSTSARRQVCPTSSTGYHVQVSDTGMTGEFARPADSVQLPLTASVLACADGGTTGPCDSVADGFVASGANPSGRWSYGYTATLGGAFVRYPDFLVGAGDGGVTGFPVVDQWLDLSVASNTAGPVPDVAYNQTVASVSPANWILAQWPLAPGQFALWPGQAGSLYSVARWTAIAQGTYVVRATFDGLDTPATSTDVHVQHNGTDVPKGTGYINVNGGGNSFDVAASVSVVANDTIDFAVGPGTDGVHAYDATALDAVVCASTGNGG